MKRLLLSLGAFIMMGAYAVAAEWFTDYNQALRTASEQKKPVLIDFTGSDWCMWCMKLDREVFATGEFKSFADKNLVLLKVDFPQRSPLPQAQAAKNEQLAGRYGVRGFPTVVVLRPDGTKAGTLGYQPGGPKAFIASVEKLTK